MRILVTGAQGFLGSHVVKKLLLDGHTVFGTTHKNIMATVPNLFYINADFNYEINVNSWIQDLQKIDVIINCIGIIKESKHNKFINVHQKAPISLFKAAEEVGVKRIIHISALGVDDHPETNYQKTKKACEEFIINKLNKIEWFIIRPSVIFGFEAPAIQMLSGLANLPVIGLPFKGTQLLQPVDVNDLSSAIVKLINPALPANQVFDVGGKFNHSYKEILFYLREYFQIKNKAAINIPDFWINFITKLTLKIAPNSFLGTTLPQLSKDSITKDDSFWKLTSTDPRDLNDILHSTPLTKTKKWAAKLFFMGPMLRLTLALFWAISGILTIIISKDFGINPYLNSSYSVISFFIAFCLIFNFLPKLTKYLQIIIILFGHIIISMLTIKGMPILFITSFLTKLYFVLTVIISFILN